jgi:3-oxoacyl-[acyl-carrier protein] reductase
VGVVHVGGAVKLLVITGASSGIGEAAARLFLAEGYTVMNISRRPCPVDGTSSLQLDLAGEGVEGALRSALADALERASEIVLVHNASLLRKDRADALASTDLRAVMEVNVVAANTLNQVVLPHMPPGSSIIYVGSTLGEKAVPGAASYAISKHALIGLMRATCQDLAGREIHTACICPGFTDTEMLRAHVGGAAEALQAIAEASTFKRLITPQEIAEAILFAARHPVINGAVFHANLGQVER